MRILALSAFALAVTVDQPEANMVQVDTPIEEEPMLVEEDDEDEQDEDEALEYIPGDEPVDEEALTQAEQDLPTVNQEIDDMEIELEGISADMDEMLPEMAESLGMKWGWFKRAVRSVKRTARRVARRVSTVARRVGGRIVNIAKSTFNWAKNKAASLVSQFKNYIRKVDVMKWVKRAVDAFFRVTESRAFKRFFFKVVGKIARRFGFRQRHVKAAYKLLTRKFWTTQIWFWKWVFTGGFIKSAKSSSGGRDFAKAQRACTDFVGTVDLGGAIMGKIRAYPQVMAAGKSIQLGARVAKPVCRVFGLMSKWKKIYNGAKAVLSKCGIHLRF